MSKPYSQFKVNELKELLKERNLSVSGTKSELISRLEEADASVTAEAPAAEEVAQDAVSDAGSTSEVAAPTKLAEAPVEDAGEVSEGKAVDPEDENAIVNHGAVKHKVTPAIPVLSDEEVAETVKRDLEQQIKRAKRFGGDVEALEARLRRVTKFGVSHIRTSATNVESEVSKMRRKSGAGRRNKKLSRGPKPATI